MLRREKLIKLRKERLMLQKDVVTKLEKEFGITITDSYYGMIEQGSRTPKLETALAIAQIFNVIPNDIFFDIKRNKNLGNESA